MNTKNVYDEHEKISTPTNKLKLRRIFPDIDECTGNSTACGEHTELCINLRGSYTCVCKPGFVLSPDRICIPSQSVTSPFTKSTAEGTARGGLITKLAGRMFQGKSAATAKMLFATNSFENNFSTNQQSTVSRLQNINATPATSNRLNSSSSIRMFTGDDATTESTAFLVNATGSPTSYAMSASQTVIVPGLFTGKLQITLNEFCFKKVLSIVVQHWTCNTMQTTIMCF